MHSIRDSLAHLPNAVGSLIGGPSSSSTMLPSPSIDETAQSMESHSVASTSLSGDDTSSERSHAIPSSLIREQWQLILDQDASIEELTNAIERCKELVLNTDECTNERKWVVRHLVELRFRLREMEDATNDSTKLCGSEYKVKPLRIWTCIPWFSPSPACHQQVILGHHFVDYQAKSIPTTKQHCDNCTGIIWSVVQASYICVDCNFCVHHKCVENVIRVCANVIASERKEPLDEICPENGLSFQQYKCTECHSSLSFSKYSTIASPTPTENSPKKQKTNGKPWIARQCYLKLKSFSHTCRSIVIDYPGWFYCLGLHSKAGREILLNAHSRDASASKLCFWCYDHLQ